MAHKGLGNSADPDASVGKWDRRLAQCVVLMRCQVGCRQHTSVQTVSGRLSGIHWCRMDGWIALTLRSGETTRWALRTSSVATDVARVWSSLPRPRYGDASWANSRTCTCCDNLTTISINESYGVCHFVGLRIVWYLQAISMRQGQKSLLSREKFQISMPKMPCLSMEPPDLPEMLWD